MDEHSTTRKKLPKRSVRKEKDKNKYKTPKKM